ncbi:alanine racemase C-terminal domain-containing protein, partial [Clostridium tertium]
MTLKTNYAHIKEINPNVGVSYGLKYKSSNKERIVTIPIGYADGFTRMQQNPKVSINGNYFDVVGRIRMDQCMVKFDNEIELNIGDQVILFGDDSRNAEDIANDLGTINYEVLCMISRRVDRVYMERNAILQVD